MRLQTFIITHIEQAITRLYQLSLNSEEGGKPQAAVRIEQPSHMEHGDYSTNIAMQLAKVLRKSPMILASEIAAQLEQEGKLEQLVEKIEVAPPGFINLFIDWSVWASRDWQLEQRRAQKAIVEHTSINPNKSAHIGHLRNACIGDSIVRLLNRAGVQVEVHNYIDDLGNQLADTVVGMLHTPLKNEHARFGDFCWDVYSSLHREYKVRPDLEQERSTVLHALEEGHNNTAWMGMLVAERIVREQLEEMEQFGIGYHLLVWESNIVREGFWDAAFQLLQQTPQFKQETAGKLAGCWVLKQGDTNHEAQGDADQLEGDHEHQLDKVLVRSNGILTYTAKDIAYHLWKFGLLGKDFGYKRFADGLYTTTAASLGAPVADAFGHADTVINVIDARQAYPQMMVKQALEVLGFQDQADQLRHISYGVVSLSPRSAADLGIDTSDGKSAYAMSGRQGIGIKISRLLDLMEQVIADNRSNPDGLSSRLIAAASIRYYLLRFNLQTEVVFDLQQATEISGNTGVYLLYAYARASTLMHRASAEHGITPQLPAAFPDLHRAEYALLRQLALWPDTLHAAVEELSPSLICTYAHELATLFNNFYGACPILKGDDASKAFRVWLTSRFHETLGDALNTLGLPTPERM
ncbi:arginine--tRNA ligase [Paenibacillus guangzhouensis]|uniref:arginine--tRNA ligase n=1 Tax=Paenibacillus guangzhouensis TaxID=1473112 RepID=UPI0012675F1C|nr:arginine--tRNA ligase [Paenibacillus guangzhouensis]